MLLVEGRGYQAISGGGGTNKLLVEGEVLISC